MTSAPASPTPPTVNAAIDRHGMKLLFDQNLSFKLCSLLVDVFLGRAR